MKRDSLDTYDAIPEAMRDYLSNYGRHFNRKLLKFALSLMTSVDSFTGEIKTLPAMTKDDVDALLTNNNIELVNNQLYDYVYVANMCKADFLNSSVPNEHYMALYIKNVIDDVDGYDGIVFNRWYADMRRKGIAIDWEIML